MPGRILRDRIGSGLLPDRSQGLVGPSVAAGAARRVLHRIQQQGCLASSGFSLRLPIAVEASPVVLGPHWPAQCAREAILA
eukprot:11015372-Alexandrium_andersonii.AAC.1